MGAVWDYIPNPFIHAGKHHDEHAGLCEAGREESRENIRMCYG